MQSQSNSDSAPQPPAINATSAALSTAAAVAAMSAAPFSSRPADQSYQIQTHSVVHPSASNNSVQNVIQTQSLLHQQGQTEIVAHQEMCLNHLRLPTMYRANAPITATHTIFNNMALRRGKWTGDEERFANALIEEFEKGSLSDCENGCTLRAYLSKKLHCAPMRISKKFAGKSIGKHVFLSRGSAGCIDSRAGHKDSEKLRQLEFHFHMSLLQEGSHNEQGLQLGSSLFPSGNCVPQLSAGSFPMPLQQNTVLPLITSNGQGSNTTSYGSGLNMTLHQGSQPPSGPSPISWPLMNASKQQNQGFIQPNNENNAITASQMQQQLLNTFKEAQNFIPQIKMETSNIENTQGIQQCTATMDINSNVTRPHQVRQDTIQTSTHSNNEDLPDLLSGFDCVTASYKLSTSNQNPASTDKTTQFHQWQPQSVHTTFSNDATSSSAQFSPTVTSKSFDDLHQFLGKDYPPSTQHLLVQPHTKYSIRLEGSATNAMKSNHPGAGMLQKNHENGEVSTVDSTSSTSDAFTYAMFAQESALAVSQHSAYWHPDGKKVSPVANVEPTLTKNKHDPLTISTFNQIQSSQREQEAYTGHNQAVNSDRSAQIPSEIREESGKATSYYNYNNTNKTAFNAENLKAHSKASQEKPDKISNTNTTSNAQNGANFANVLGHHSNIVSGSERSSDVGTSSTACSTNGSSSGSGSGSDNASDNDNSDSGSDEGRGSSSTENNKRKVKADAENSSTDRITKRSKWKQASKSQ